MEKGKCCICETSLDSDEPHDDICLECKVSLQVVRTENGLIVTR